MASCVATYTWAAYEVRLRARLGVASGSEDALKGLLARAARAADQFMGNPFDDSSDIAPATHPLDIWEGMVAWMTVMWRLGPGASAAGAGMTPGLASVNTGDLSESYATGADGKGLTPGQAALEAAKDAWWPFKLRVWT